MEGNGDEAKRKLDTAKQAGATARMEYEQAVKPAADSSKEFDIANDGL